MKTGERVLKRLLGKNLKRQVFWLPKKIWRIRRNNCCNDAGREPWASKWRYGVWTSNILFLINPQSIVCYLKKSKQIRYFSTPQICSKYPIFDCEEPMYRWPLLFHKKNIVAQWRSPGLIKTTSPLSDLPIPYFFIRISATLFRWINPKTELHIRVLIVQLWGMDIPAVLPFVTFSFAAWDQPDRSLYPYWSSWRSKFFYSTSMFSCTWIFTISINASW